MIESRSIAADDWVCLCYHDVQPSLARAGGGPAEFTMPVADPTFSASVAGFECMLDTIAGLGYRGCSLADGFQQQGRRVAITFDDGNLGQYEHAMPALLARGMTATFYVVTDWVGRAGYMTWEHLRELVASGMSVQSHTKSHHFLSELGLEDLRKELSASKLVLEDKLGRSTFEIAFPGGDAPAKSLRHMMAETGYRVAVGTLWGVNHGVSEEKALRKFVRRCTVRRDITPEAAQQIIEADKWLGLRLGAKQHALRGIRNALGPSRYIRWRHRVLGAVRA